MHALGSHAASLASPLRPELQAGGRGDGGGRGGDGGIGLGGGGGGGCGGKGGGGGICFGQYLNVFSPLGVHLPQLPSCLWHQLSGSNGSPKLWQPPSYAGSQPVAPDG